MTKYKFAKPVKINGESEAVFLLQDSGDLFIPFDAGNADYQSYLKWLEGCEVVNGEMVKTSEGNVTLPADEPAQG
jgi:hypothetical protein